MYTVVVLGPYCYCVHSCCFGTLLLLCTQLLFWDLIVTVYTVVVLGPYCYCARSCCFGALLLLCTQLFLSITSTTRSYFGFPNAMNGSLLVPKEPKIIIL